MKIYIAGPMTGLPEFNYPAFNAAEYALGVAGFTDVVNPSGGYANPAHRSEALSWEQYMVRGLTGLLACRGVAVLPGSENSKGAQLELTVARALDLEIHNLADWLFIPHARVLAHARLHRALDAPPLLTSADSKLVENLSAVDLPPRPSLVKIAQAAAVAKSRFDDDVKAAQAALVGERLARGTLS